MKVIYKYIPSSPGGIVIYSRTALTPWVWHAFRRYDPASSTPYEAFCEYVRSAERVELLGEVGKYWWREVKDFARTLRPVTFVSVPGTMYRNAADIFKKLPLVVSFNRDVPDLMDVDDRRLRWYNFIHLYVSDTDWKYKWGTYRFLEPPTWALTFFGRWTLKFQRTAGVVDDLYWEDMMEYLWNGMPRENIGKSVLKSYHGDAEDIYTIKSYLR